MKRASMQDAQCLTVRPTAADRQLGFPRNFLLFEYLVRVTVDEADGESHSRPHGRSTINPTHEPRRSAKHTVQAHILNRQSDNDQYDEAKKQKRSFGRLVARAHAHHLALASCMPSASMAVIC